MPWELSGNLATDPTTDFVGTLDDQPVVIRVNNHETVRFNGGEGSTVEIAAQDGLAVNGFQPFITLRDTNGGNARACVQGVNGDIVLIPNSFIGGGAAMVLKTESGSIGVGTSDPSSKVEIIAQDGLAVTGFQPFITLRDTNGGNARACVQGVNGDIVLIPNSFIGGGAAMVLKTGSGNIGVGTSTPEARLHVVGTVIADDVILPNKDCAEEFDTDVNEDIEPGDVVVVGQDERLCLCSGAYDRRAAGVISGAGDRKPGVVLGRRASDQSRLALALSGTAWCKADAQSSPIEVGDLLTTSETPGHAMRATDPRRAFGAVIGKALRPLRSGRGMVPALISLQ
jgi:hypothetical protein